MVKIRMARGGTNKVPFYRLVVTNSRSPRDGKFLETVGTWDPRKAGGTLILDQARYDHWLKVGAQPSELVAKIISRNKRAATATPTKS